MKPIYVPNTIDDPPHMLLWSADELAPILMGLAIGMMTGNALVFTAIGVGITYAYRKYRDGRPDGYLMHMLYWYGFWPSRSKSIPNPFARRYLP
jgi:conjugal transfer pilus assembly protein TraL